MLNLFEGSMCLTNIWTRDSSSTRMWFRQYLRAVVQCIGSRECITLVGFTDIIMVENSIVGQFRILLNTSPSIDYNFPISPFFFSYPLVLEDTQKVLVQIGYVFSCKICCWSPFSPFFLGLCCSRFLNVISIPQVGHSSQFSIFRPPFARSKLQFKLWACGWNVSFMQVYARGYVSCFHVLMVLALGWQDGSGNLTNSYVVLHKKCFLVIGSGR